MASLLECLSNWGAFNAVVVGDFMLDQLVYGDAERLTADAPVPVLHVRRTSETPGGAASVASDLAALRGSVRVIGVVGNDAEGAILRDRLGEAGIDPSGLVADAARPTTVKRNLIGLAQHRHPQKMFRVDFESRDPISGEALERVMLAFEAALATADVVALEDYGKGVCAPEVCARIFELAKAAGVPVLVDPAPMPDFSRYRGCDAITPNRTEAERATGLNDPEAMARAMADTLGAEAVVLTLDKEGALLLERGEAPSRVPTTARQVYDVTGAGDMVLAALCAARANGASWPDAVRFANAAAGLEVEVFGVQPIPFERVYQAILTGGRSRGDKVRSLGEAVIEVAAARREGKRVVFTNGCFDIIHAGHIELLRRAAAMGDLLVIGLNSDDSVRRLKGQDRPVHAEGDRCAVLGELRSVGAVVVFDEDTPERLIEALRPDVLVKGADYSKDEVVGGAFVESYGGEVALIDLLEGRSTTGAIERIRSG